MQRMTAYFLNEKPKQNSWRTARFAVASVAAVIAASTGVGIARAMSYQVDDLVKAGSLVKLLEAYERAPIPATLIYPCQRQVPLKLRAFLDFSVPLLRDRLGYKNP